MRAAKRREKNARTHERCARRMGRHPRAQQLAPAKIGELPNRALWLSAFRPTKQRAMTPHEERTRQSITTRTIFFKRPGSLGCCCCSCSGDYKGPARHVARGSTTALKQKKSCGGASGAAREHSLHLDPPPPRKRASYRPLPLSRRSRRHPAAEPKPAKIPRRAQWFAAIKVSSVTPVPV